MSHFQNNPFSNNSRGSSGSYGSLNNNYNNNNNNRRTIIQNGQVRQINTTHRSNEPKDDVDIQFLTFFTVDSFKRMGKNYWKLLVKVLLWMAIQYYFIKIEFGAVFFVFSCFALILLNLGKRDKNSLSAYNVFNKNFENILLSKSKESLERDLGRNTM
ncbi:hypothetical protein DDB_G0272933 [Dictyostelium discoideum AX4]|uniref:SAYSvFN domain-containing protein n=1 Tax=Dictyostelium discoideum TaxID=44689 RepID=Q559H0_DICDI|nr:hypothetical protein DDB_G0272933 [Dictyostelium discoideum AX4]EAL71104.1 hypothetical protein DDB_G0272933 [Dictyostelium discoideum AX4]|eukprot:XP_644846.1 hypothetical protein DDB_G0272933 [Dictyostelium discoideum AX4]